MKSERSTFAQAINAVILWFPEEFREDIDDGHHSFWELYAHRHILVCNLINLVSRMNSYASEDKFVERYWSAWKSKTHYDGIMYDWMFIAGIGTEPGNTLSYHLPLEYWDKIDNVCEIDHAPEWDGHTTDDTLALLNNLTSAWRTKKR